MDIGLGIVASLLKAERYIHMNTKRLFAVLLPVLGIVLIAAVGLALAQEGPPGDGRQPLSPEAPDAHSSYIPVQGRLTDAAGNPLDGDYQIIFSLYAQYSGGVPLCTQSKSVGVDNGLFSTYISGLGCSIDGRQLYLGVQVGDDPEMTPRLYVDNVPYAWTLRPGAVISDSMPGIPLLHIENWGDEGRGLRSYAMAESGANYGIVGASRSPDGIGGYFYNNSGGIGLSGASTNASGVGVLAKGLDGGADLILGGNADTGAGDDGNLASDPDYASSDLVLKSNDTIRLDLDNDGDGEDADFEIRDASDTLLFNVDESGAVTSGGAGIAAFPRPAYDSGLKSVDAGSTVDLLHNLGGDIDNYFVDLTCQHTVYGRHTWGLGGDSNSPETYGVYWLDLTPSEITVRRESQDGECPQVRVRIWMYP